MGSDVVFPLVFWGVIILLGIVLYLRFKKRTKDKKRFEFHGWQKLIYYIGLLNIFNLVFWIVMYRYAKRYKNLNEYEKNKKYAYVVYYFGYVLIIITAILVIINIIVK